MARADGIGSGEEPGYDGLLPVQAKWLDHLMLAPEADWPAGLGEYVAAQRPGNFDAVADAIGCWIKRQRD